MHKTAFSCVGLFVVVCLSAAIPLRAQTNSEKGQICEARPVMRCLDKEKIEGTTIKVPIDDAAIQKNAFQICDSSYNYTTSPDVVLIMDNTGSMDSVGMLNGIPRWCPYPDKEVDDPGCISGDPRRLRGPALQTFLDSALVKGGKGGVNVGVVLFSYIAEAQSDTLLPLTAATKDSIKASIQMRQSGETNYTAAFRAAMNLLKSSRKPKQEQFIIFVSDGRPNSPQKPDGDPYMYKTFWDSLPVVHSIFLGDNAANYKDMQDIAAKTGGLFFHFSDVSLLAKTLTDDISKQLFRRAVPTLTTIRNQTNATTFQIDAAGHIAEPDSGAFTLNMPGPLYLSKGVNDIVVKTEYGYGGVTQDVHFKIERTDTGPYDSALVEACRDLPKLILYNAQNQAINLLGLPYTFADSLLQYSLTTNSGLDSFNVIVTTKSTQTSQQDLESIPNGPGNLKDSTWSGGEPFQHQTIQKAIGDKKIQVDHGETVIVTYKNPYIPEDSVQAKVKIKYGPDLDKASYWDLDGDGRIETVVIKYMDVLANLPDKLAFHIVDEAGVTADRTAQSSTGEIVYGVTDSATDKTKLVVTLKDPFPYGITSVANADSSGHTFRQNNIPMVDGAFRVDDSVPPVIVSATVVGPDKDHTLSRVLVTYSEKINLSTPAIEPIVFRRDTVVFNSTQIPINRIEKLSDREYAFHLEAGAQFTPVGGDSVAINNNGETSDGGGKTPKTKVYAPVGGGAPSQSISDFYVTFANGDKNNAVGAGTTSSPNAFIPVDSKGYALPGNSNGKCGSCNAQDGNVFTGSVIYVVTENPVNYSFTIFSNLGQVVARGSGVIEEADLPLLDKIEDPSHDPNKTQYVQRIVWTGLTDDGALAGTGAYVLKSVFKYDRSFKTGARPSLNTKFVKFGFLRQCCSTPDPHWVQQFYQ